MDKIEICNLALARIGAATIDRLNEASEQARACNQFYDSCRRAALRNFPWSFATRRVKLTLIADKQFDYEYAYRYPTGAIFIRKLFDAEHGWPIKDPKYQIISDISGKEILTNMELAGCEYTADIEDASLFDPEFCEALAWKLGSEIAMRITGNVQMAQYCTQNYEHYITEARADNDNEHDPDRIHVNEITAARWCGIEFDDPTRDYIG